MLRSHTNVRSCAIGLTAALVFLGCGDGAKNELPEGLYGDWSGGNTSVNQVRFSEGGRMELNGGECAGQYYLVAVDITVATLESGYIDCPGVMDGNVTDLTVRLTDDGLEITGPVLNGSWTRGAGGGAVEGETQTPTSMELRGRAGPLEVSDCLSIQAVMADSLPIAGWNAALRTAGGAFQESGSLGVCFFSPDSDFDFSSYDELGEVVRVALYNDDALSIGERPDIAEEFAGFGDEAFRMLTSGGNPVELVLFLDGLEVRVWYAKDTAAPEDVLGAMESIAL